MVKRQPAHDCIGEPNQQGGGVALHMGNNPSMAEHHAFLQSGGTRRELDEGVLGRKTPVRSGQLGEHLRGEDLRLRDLRAPRLFLDVDEQRAESGYLTDVIDSSAVFRFADLRGGRADLGRKMARFHRSDIGCEQMDIKLFDEEDKRGFGQVPGEKRCISADIVPELLPGIRKPFSARANGTAKSAGVLLTEIFDAFGHGVLFRTTGLHSHPFMRLIDKETKRPNSPIQTLYQILNGFEACRPMVYPRQLKSNS